MSGRSPGGARGPGELGQRQDGERAGRLDGKVAVVTGGSSGLALASARLFASEGARVVVTGRRQEALDEAVALIGPRATGVQGDAADLDALDRLYATVRAEHGSIDVLLASAGTASGARLGEITEEHVDAVFGLNARGTLFTVQKALPLLNDGASVILTGTHVAAKGWPGLSVYAASKAALRSFAGTWSQELKDRRIRVNVLSPGAIATEAMDQLDDETRRRSAERVPRGSMGRPEEVAAAALFLASAESAFVNGVELTVDGGSMAV